MTDENAVKLVNRDGKIVGIDPETGEEVPIKLGSGLGSEEGPVPDTSHFEALHTEQARITGDEAVTIDVPGDFDTLREAIENVSELLPPKLDVDVEINIESGHDLEEETTIKRRDLSHVSVVSEDDTVDVSSSFDGDNVLLATDGAVAPLWDCSIDCGGYSDGLRAEYMSRLRFGEGVTILNAESTNIDVAQTSFAQGRGITANGAGYRNISLGNNSYASFRGALIPIHRNIGVSRTSDLVR